MLRSYWTATNEARKNFISEEDINSDRYILAGVLQLYYNNIDKAQAADWIF
jgi:hypothetical protein